MHSAIECEEVDQRMRLGLNDCAISRITDIPRETIRDWRKRGIGPRDLPRGMRPPDEVCPTCSGAALPMAPYTYLLGFVLGRRLSLSNV